VALELDPEILQAALAAMAGAGRPAPAARADWKALRAAAEAGLTALEAALPEHPQVSREDFRASSHDGAPVPLRWYAPPGHDAAGTGPAAVYLHGGGMIAGTLELHDRLVAGYVADSGVPMLSVGWRRAPEHPHPCPVEDSYAGLSWLAANAAGVGVDPARIALMGDSAGGGLAAGAALLARGRGTHVVRQVLIYPMLDDRTTVPDPHLAPYAGWSYDDNYTGWHALLGDAIGRPDVPESAAPARARDLAGLAPAYIEVGELDIFRDESVVYARRLSAAGVSAELHVHPGCPHGFDRVAPAASVTRRSRADRLRVLKTL
jgi:acetyl esterase/lipase